MIGNQRPGVTACLPLELYLSPTTGAQPLPEARARQERLEGVGCNRTCSARACQCGNKLPRVSDYDPPSNSACLNRSTLQFSFTARCSASSKPVWDSA